MQHWKNKNALGLYISIKVKQRDDEKQLVPNRECEVNVYKNMQELCNSVTTL